MAQFTYTSKTHISILDQATAHGTIDVYGVKGPVKGASIEVTGFTHGFPNDLDMLLVAPDGQHNFKFMSDVGGFLGYSGISFGFSDTAAMMMAATIVSGTTYLPSDAGVAETAANWGLSIPVINGPAGATFASSFGGIDGNGIWSLYVRDDASNDAGSINRWKLTVNTDEAHASLRGGAGDDFIRVIGNDASGVFEINERGAVAYSGVLLFTIESGAGNDLILGSKVVDVIDAGSGRDTVYAGAGVDYITIGTGDDQAGEIYDGGSGEDTLVVDESITLDLRDDIVNAIEHLLLEEGGKVLIKATQLGGVATVTGASDPAHPDEFAVTVGDGMGVNLGLINFIQFNQPGDLVSVIGDKDGETVLGSSVNDLISTKGGSDYILASLGRDTIDGGKGDDALDYTSTNGAVRVTLNGSKSVNVLVDGQVKDIIRNVEFVWGGSAGDILKGDKKDNGLKGGGGADKLKGGAGDDVLDGGLGADTVSGGAGKDLFYFTAAIDGVDKIKDFSHADDTIMLDNDVFASFAKEGGISSKAFKAQASGHEATTAKQKLIYDKSDGSLWYDADGTGNGAAIKFAVLSNKPSNLSFNDFEII